MKKLRILTVLFLTCFAVHHSYSQSQPLSTVQSSHAIQWHYLSPFGQYFLYSNNTLKHISPESGESVWENSSLPGLTKDAFKRLANSPFYIIESDGKFQILDPYSGDAILNSIDLIIQNVVAYRYFSQSNQILISGTDKEQKNHMLLISLNSGTTNWSGSDNGDLVDAYLLQNRDVVFSTHDKIYRINPESGSLVWETNIIPDEESAGVAGFKLIGGSGKPKPANNFLIHPSMPVAYVGFEIQKSQPTPADPNAKSYSTEYYAFNLKDGSHLWKQPLKAGGQLGALLFKEKGFIGFTSAMVGSKINLFQNDSEQTGLWGNKKNGFRVKGTPTDFSDVEAGTVVFSQFRTGSGYLYFINKATSMEADEEIKVDGDLHAVKGLGNNMLLVMTSEAAYLINIANGKFEINKSIPTSPALIAENADQIFIYDKKDNLIKTVNTKTGALNELSKKIKLKSKEDLNGMELINEGLIVHSLEEIISFGLDGAVKYHTTFEGPKKGITDELKVAQEIRTHYMQVAKSDVVRSSKHALTLEIMENNNLSGNSTSKYQKQHLESVRKRLNMASRQQMMFTIAAGDSNSLQKINLTTGEQLSSTSLGNDKRPDYLFDEIAGYLYFKSGDNTVQVFKP